MDPESEEEHEETKVQMGCMIIDWQNSHKMGNQTFQATTTKRFVRKLDMNRRIGMEWIKYRVL